MKKSILLVLFMLCACVVYAQQNVDIHLNDLSILSTPLASLDKMTMHGDTLYVTRTDGGVNHAVHMSSIDYIDFSGDYIETAVEPQDVTSTAFYISNNMLVLECDVEGAKSIFSIDGKLITTLSNTERMLNISALPTGVYVLVMGKQTIKFSKP